jgi:hypothetical protein
MVYIVLCLTINILYYVFNIYNIFNILKVLNMITVYKTDDSEISLNFISIYLIFFYRLRWSRGSVLAFGTQVCRFKPGRSRRIFKGEKILSTPSLRGEAKPSVPCRRFAVCKRSLELRGSRILRQNLSEHFSPTKSSTFRC